MAAELKLARVMQWRGKCFGKQWTIIDVLTIVYLVSLHGLALLAPFHFNWSAFWVAAALYYVTAVSVTLSFHRNLSHRSFKLPRWLEYTFAYCAVLAHQGSPIEWVSSHRTHHQFADKPNDPHTPTKGFCYSHFGWICFYYSRFPNEEAQLMKNAGDLKKQWYYRFLHYTYVFHALSLGVVLYILGGLPFLVWGLGVRLAFISQITFTVNSVGHTWGNQVWETGDSSRNNWWVALLSNGDGWHNNHHAFEYSARHGLEWWQIDVTWYVIRFLELVGLATEVKLPSEAQKKRKAFCNNSVDSTIDTKEE